MTKTIPWWVAETTQTHIENIDNMKQLVKQIATLRSNLENWKNEWKSITAKVTSIYNENLELIAQRDEAWDTIESLKHQLQLRMKMIIELRAFIDQERLNQDKWDKRHDEAVEEINKRKFKKARITGS